MLELINDLIYDKETFCCAICFFIMACCFLGIAYVIHKY